MSTTVDVELRMCYRGFADADSMGGFTLPDDMSLLHSLAGCAPQEPLSSLHAGAAARFGSTDVLPTAFPEVLDTQGLIGSGGFGNVYHCAVEGIEQPVAVKVLKGCMSAGGCREARVLMDLDHKNLVRLLRVLGGEERVALVLELCTGGTLQKALHEAPHQQSAPLGLPQRLAAGLDVAFALEYIHSRNIVHRDVKAANVLLTEPIGSTEAGQARMPPVKLGDLGLARFLAASTTIMTSGVGTITYMAPEVMSGEDYGMPADVFSLAILLHEAASQQVPYGSMDNPRLAVEILGGRRPLKQALPAGSVGEELFELLAASWCEQPEERLSAGGLAARLRGLLAGA